MIQTAWIAHGYFVDFPVTRIIVAHYSLGSP
jgi:hypothetical protein